MGQEHPTIDELRQQVREEEERRNRLKKVTNIQLIGGPDGKSTMIRAFDQEQFDAKLKTSPSWLEFISATYRSSSQSEHEEDAKFRIFDSLGGEQNYPLILGSARVQNMIILCLDVTR